MLSAKDSEIAVLKIELHDANFKIAALERKLERLTEANHAYNRQLSSVIERLDLLEEQGVSPQSPSGVLI